MLYYIIKRRSYFNKDNGGSSNYRCVLLVVNWCIWQVDFILVVKIFV